MGMKFKRVQSGFAAVEMTLITPFMLLLIGGLIEVTHFLQANSILIGVTREGANLVSRTSSSTPNEIMTLVSKTTGDLNLSSDGVIYITLVTGQEDDDPYVNEQYIWSDSGLSHSSSVWNGCTSWTNHQCDLETPPPTIASFPVSLEPNESVYVVEVHYQYSPLANLYITSGFVMSDITYL